MADQILQEIKDRLNVADVIAGYIPIKKAGVNFKALCPFHHEKTPSMNISTSKQIWHCFGCGEGGDVFSFVMKYENIEFRDALKILADKAGVQLPAYSGQNQGLENEKDLLLRINDFASRYYHQVLLSKTGLRALEYLKKRGLSETTIKNWRIGYAPDDFHALENALAQKKVSVADLVKAGVSAKNERGQMYDRFRGRITFPIYNYFGEVVGFSARLLEENPNAAKYVNSPETIIYNKSKILFGLNFAKDSIRKKDEAVIVEGQMDLIQSHQAGFTNVVASSGTALNETSLTQLGRLTKNLKFCFDADSAGLAAARRAGELALKAGFRLKLIILKGAKDPDELIKRSPGLWEKAVNEAVWFLDFYIESAELSFAPGSVEQKHFLSKEVMPFLQFITDPLELDHYIHKMVTKFSISEKVIREQLKKTTQTPLAVEKLPKAQGSFGSLRLQKEVLGGLLVLPDFAIEAKAVLEPLDFEDEEIQHLYEQLSTVSGQSAVKQATVAKEAIFMIESQLEEIEGKEEALTKILQKSLALLKLNSIKKQQLKLQTDIKVAEGQKDRQKMEELNKKFVLLSALRLEFEKKA